MVSIEHIAKVCHEANRAYCQLLGDTSQPSWEEAPEWQRKSAILGVQHHLKYPSATSEDGHTNWLKVKVQDGWTYGPVKDVEKKQHPCMVPYDELPTSEKMKDTLFGSIVRALGAHHAE